MGECYMLSTVSADRSYATLESQLAYHFRDLALLETALTHKSYLNENPGCGRSDSERLEFLGDAVVDLIIGHLLMTRNPALHEGDLSVLRSRIVHEQGLAQVASELSLGEWLFLGRGEEQTGGRRKPSLLADACEAIIAAVYLDGGFDSVFRVVERLFERSLADVAGPSTTDFKTRLQERAQAILRETPRYAVVGEAGPDHEKTFEVVVKIGGEEFARAGGRSKKEAEQRAAERALEKLEAPPTG